MQTTKKTETVMKKATKTEATKKRQGFASMDPVRVRELAAIGGKTAHERGTAHQFSSDEAREAGRKGGIAAHATRGPRGTVR